MFAFAKRPRWVVLHALLAIVVGLFALAGVWQLDQLSERRDHNALIRQRRAEPVASFDRLFKAPFDAEHRRARGKGRYATEHEIVLRGRGDRGRPGNHVLTPLVLSEDRAILVDRGWVPFDLADPPVLLARPSSDELEVTGVVLPSEGAVPLAGADARARPLQISRIDVARIARALPYAMLPLYLALTEQKPPQDGLPDPLTPLPLDEGPHLLYAAQWFLFIVIALVGYGAILRREARKTSG